MQDLHCKFVFYVLLTSQMYGGFLTNNMLILKILPIVPIESLGQPFHCQMVSLMFAKEAIVCGGFLIIKHRLRFLVKI